MNYFIEVQYSGFKNAIKLRPNKNKTIDRLKKDVESQRKLYISEWCLQGGRGSVSKFSSWKTDRIPKQLISLFEKANICELSGNKLDVQFILKSTDKVVKIISC